MRVGLPSRSNSQQSVRRGYSPQRAFVVQVGGSAVTGMESVEIHAASGGGRLHRLRDLRRCLPGAQQIRSAVESHQYAAAVAAARNRAHQLEFLSFDSGNGSPPDFDRLRAQNAGATAVV